MEPIGRDRDVAFLASVGAPANHGMCWMVWRRSPRLERTMMRPGFAEPLAEQPQRVAFAHFGRRGNQCDAINKQAVRATMPKAMTCCQSTAAR